MPLAGATLAGPVRPAKVLQRGLEAGRNRPAIVSLEGSWTWAELEDKANRLAANYLALGLEPGDRVASLMPNRIELLAHYLACFKSGLVTAPLNYRYTPPEIDHALSVSGARIILAHVESERHRREHGSELAARYRHLWRGRH